MARLRATRVLVSSGTMHAVAEALALAEAGYDVTFATTICFRKLSWFPEWPLLRGLKRRFAARLFPELSAVGLRRQAAPEFIHRILQAAGIGGESWRFKVHNVLFDAWAARWVGRQDILHFVNGVGLYSARKAKAAGKTVVLSQRAEHPLWVTPLLRDEHASLGMSFEHPEAAFMDRVLEEQRLADCILVPSRYCAGTFLEQGVDPSKLRVVPYGYNQGRFRAQAKKPDGTFRVLFVGNLEPRKGIRYLVEAFRLARLPKAELVLVGKMATPLKHALWRGLADVRHIPHLPQPELARFYQEASVFVLPSLADAWGFVVLEAMAAGTPVIVSENTGSKEAVRPGEDGFIVPIRDAEAIAERLVELYRDPGRRCWMGENASLRSDDYSWPAYFAKMKVVYETVAGAPRRAEVDA